MPFPQQNQVYNIPTSISVLQPFDPNLVPAPQDQIPVPLDPPTYEWSSWSMNNYDHPENHCMLSNNSIPWHTEGKTVIYDEIINCNIAIPYSSSGSHVDLITTSLSCFPSGSNPRDPQVPSNQRESIDAIMSSLSFSSSASLSSSSFVTKHPICYEP
ncbi:hypothetical protein RHGRI_035377 [Rhododendron griersonianum]|uniref:Uncharacterized protein n=1 Tax=Rhododendron griersonianum TaxID=479676 RepID=A0AAV6I7Q1_9ERIC|nr:hypothetical protein RHGRI_035377 [Rhododendron griersonianum]